MLGEVGLDGELDAAQFACELPPAVVVHRLLVVLHGRPVAEGRGAERARDGLPGVRRPHVPVEAGPPRELAFALRAREALPAGRVRLCVAGQGLLVLEGGAAVGAGEVLAGGGVQVLVYGEVVLAAERLEAEPAAVSEQVGGLVGALVALQAVAPLERLAAVGAHVVAVGAVRVHVRREVLLEAGRVLALLAPQQDVAGALALLLLALLLLLRLLLLLLLLWCNGRLWQRPRRQNLAVRNRLARVVRVERVRVVIEIVRSGVRLLSR